VDVRVPVIDRDGESIGSLLLGKLPRGIHAPALDGSVGQVVEGAVYRFEVMLDEEPGFVALEPGDELFSFDSDSCLAGRLLPRQHVGTVRVGISVPNSDVAGIAVIEVAPTKLEYASEYQQMLGDIATVATEALLQGFAPASLTLAQDSVAGSNLLYQQFAFLSARLASREVQDALALIVANPHRTWYSETELQAAGRPLPANSSLSRAVTRPGQRVRTHGRLRIASVPLMLERHRTEATFDSPPNRFVKYALERWRSIAQRLVDALGATDLNAPGPVRRGRSAARDVREQIDRVLSAPLFGQVGRLDVFPSANQVLHRQQGYREVFRTFALAEVGARLSLDLDVEDLFSASQRNVATLYEYWAFLQLVEAVGVACGDARTVDAFALASDGLSLGFRQGRESGVRWETAAGGRQLEVEVFFNRHFRSSTEPLKASSWSRAMRPDCSVRVRPRTSLPRVQEGSLDVWLHFDAKYRVERAREQFDADAGEPDSAAVEAEAIERLDRSKREDLLKMHAYRDAIRGSAGAYVLFPGDVAGAPFREFDEPLPGLGAFPLRPSDVGRARGREALESFVREVLAHVADRASQDERYRYWRAAIRGRPEQGIGGSWLPPLTLPPRDAIVLCGVLRGQEEADWVSRMQTYALPADAGSGSIAADSVELRAEWAFLGVDGAPASLWSRDGAWFVQTRGDLLESGYPDPTADGYLCAIFRPVHTVPDWLADVDLVMLTDRSGVSSSVVATTWADLVEAGAEPRAESANGRPGN
jgi:predicted component of viral defense system (DUF524 family)